MEVHYYFKDQLASLRIFPHAYFEIPKDREVIMLLSEHDVNRLERSVPLREALGKIFHLKPERLEISIKHVDEGYYEMVVKKVCYPEEG